MSAVQVFWKHWGKGEIAHNEQFLLFPQCFFFFFEALSAIFIKFKNVICKVSEFENVSFGKGLNKFWGTLYGETYHTYGACVTLTFDITYMKLENGTSTH